MNHLLHQISWHQYLTVALVIAVIYYMTIIMRYCQPELQNLQKRLSGNTTATSLQALQYEASKEESKAAPQQDLVEYFPEQGSQEQNISDTDILAGQLKATIAKAADKPFAPAVLIPQLKHILQEHYELALAERPVINHLIVDECEKTGTALLTEEEVDQWWER
jgi:hypothetical protein